MLEKQEPHKVSLIFNYPRKEYFPDIDSVTYLKMPEEKNIFEVGNLDKDDFKPLDIFKGNSSEYVKLPELTELTLDPLQRNAQDEMGFQSFDVRLYKNRFATYIFVLFVQWPVKGQKTITQYTLFDVDVESETEEKRGQSSAFCKSVMDVALVDIVKCKFKNETRAVVGMLCIPIEIKWLEHQYHSNSYREWFDDPKPETKVRIKIQRQRTLKGDVPFSYCDSDENYAFAMQYAVKKPAEREKLVHVRTSGSGLSTGNLSLVLFPGAFLHRHHRNGQVSMSLLIWVAYKNVEGRLMTTETPITANVTITKGSEENKCYYQSEVSVNPTSVDLAERRAYVHLPLNDTDGKTGFFEEAYKDIPSIEVSCVLTRRD